MTLLLTVAGLVAYGCVEDGVVEALDGFVCGGKHVKDDDFVCAGPEPGAGEVERLLRANVPEAAEVVAVDPDDAFAEMAEVEEGARGCGDIEFGMEESGRAKAGGDPGIRRGVSISDDIG